jgi:pimeloyl-ACP methyl ester carboxylesterase
LPPYLRAPREIQDKYCGTLVRENRLGLPLAVCLTAITGCSTRDHGTSAPPDAGSAIILSSPCADSLDAIYGDPGGSPKTQGAILKCAHERDFNVAELDALARANGYAGRPLTSGAQGFRVVYGTERGSQPPVLGSSSATVLIPTAPRPGPLPVVVVAHGATGEAGACADSRTNLTATSGDAVTVMLAAFAGDGYVVISPDYAGYVNYGAPGTLPTGEFLAADVGKSVLDGARALRTLTPSAVSDKVVLVGHSEGGHAVLSALTMHENYGSGGTLAGVAAYSPFWFNSAAWGAMFLVASEYPLNPPSGGAPFAVGIGVWYHYSQGELLDGPGHGLDVFATDKRQAIKEFVDTTCIGGNDSDFALLKKLGTSVTDLYDPTFVRAVKIPAAFGQPCTTDPTLGPICEKWMARYAASRPHLTGAAASTPLLLLYGGEDAVIPPERAVCGFERIKEDKANYTFCYEQSKDHWGIVDARAEYVNDWIASLTLGGSSPPPCTAEPSSVVADGGAPATCATNPPN